MRQEVRKPAQGLTFCLGASLFAAIASLARLRRRHDNLFLDLAVVGGTLPA
ncbi:hypothetical protein ACSS6W_009699 [Trichoderma asperelloides]